MGIKPWELRMFVKGQVCHTEYTLHFTRESLRCGTEEKNMFLKKRILCLTHSKLTGVCQKNG